MTMAENNTNNSSNPPLYVRIPKQGHEYLDRIKAGTGISKNDSITLLLYVASKVIDEQKMLEMFDEYMLEGDVVRTMLQVK